MKFSYHNPLDKNKKQEPFDKKMENIQRTAYLSKKGIKPATPLQLDLLFPSIIGRSDLRHLPNDYARSSLFTTKNKNQPRDSLLHQKLFHYNNDISILYTGIELRAEDDEIVWLQILNYGQSVQLGQPFNFFLKDLVKDIGWPRNGRYYDKARECISRLKANEVLALNLKAYGKSEVISLIKNYTVVNDSEGKPTEYAIEIDPCLIVLFAGNTFTSHKWNVYRDLSPVARRLADYIESHQHPYPLSIDKFRQICGSNNSSKTSWRQTVKKACAEIEDRKIAARAWVIKDQICCVTT
jgi:hypothetical protein